MLVDWEEELVVIDFKFPRHGRQIILPRRLKKIKYDTLSIMYIKLDTLLGTRYSTLLRSLIDRIVWYCSRYGRLRGDNYLLRSIFLAANLVRLIS